MRVYFNIGLNLPTGGMLDGMYVMSQLVRDGLTVHCVKDSDTEPTVVASMDRGKGSCCSMLAAVLAAELADVFRQDAVAYYIPELGIGGLAGPKASEWGTFDPSLFILPCGNRITNC